MKLTRKQAFELSIRKWEALARGEDVPEDIRALRMEGDCGLCKKYFITYNKKLDSCALCPIRPRLEDYNDLDSVGCGQKNHPYKIWSRNRNSENAQKVLDLIKSKM